MKTRVACYVVQLIVALCARLKGEAILFAVTYVFALFALIQLPGCLDTGCFLTEHESFG